MTRTTPAIVAALAALLVATPTGMAQTFSDPANLRGERVNARNGRELPIDGGQGNAALGLAQMMRKLKTRASLMLIVAHPDDEDGGMLTFYSRGYGARVAVLTLNRGEGGQNAMTGDFEDALGLLRTQELLSADRYFGVQQMFGTEVDFGFSKTKAEAFAKWTHQRVLYDAVRAVRLYRPLVIASVFSGSVTDGHGQHQVAGEIAQEVFNAAADPNVFPELTKEGILPWAPMKVYERVPMQAITAQGLFDYATGQHVPAEFTNYVNHTVSSTPPQPDVVVNEGNTDALLTAAAANPADFAPVADPHAPMSYVQFGRIGLGLQKSQIGPGDRRAPRAGKYDVAYHRYGSRLSFQPNNEVNFFDGIDVTLNGWAKLAPALSNDLRLEIVRLTGAITDLSDSYDPSQPTSSVLAPLAEAQSALDRLIRNVEEAHLPEQQSADVLHELRIKHAQLNDALALALQIDFDATAHGADQITGTDVPVWTSLRVGVDASLTLTSERVANARGNDIKAADLDHRKSDLHAGHAIQRSIKADSARAGVSITGTVTRPYFTRKNIEEPVYTLLDPSLRGAPATPPALTAWATIDYRGLPVEVGRVVHDGAQAVSFVPPVSIAVSPHAQLFPDAEKSVQFTASISPDQKLMPRIAAPPGWKATALPDSAAKRGVTVFQLSGPQKSREPGVITASAVTPDHRTFTEGYRTIGYGDLPRTHYFTPATDRVVPAELTLPPAGLRRIGYVAGTGDAVPEALAAIGLPVTMLTVGDLTADKLKAFDTVILGVRTYNAHPDLHGASTQALFDFARSGGNVVVQYQTDEFGSGDAPFPLDLGGAEKVVDETTPVLLLDRANPLLNTPNRIAPADFNGWLEERGHGFLASWDAHYAALTETHDPGEPAEHIQPQAPQRGGLVTVPLGKGRWTYVAFALYRQLPEAVPGAFRLFVNLVTPPSHR